MHLPAPASADGVAKSGARRLGGITRLLEASSAAGDGQFPGLPLFAFQDQREEMGRFQSDSPGVFDELDHIQASLASLDLGDI